ncbi:MAG: hypothetical protein IK066_11890 [Kiritimatiellae bacterium]|nr:hypothetical protein [Kiritimatiellia bacterium]
MIEQMLSDAAAADPETAKALRLDAFERAAAGGEWRVDLDELRPGYVVTIADGSKLRVGLNDHGDKLLDGGRKFGFIAPKGDFFVRSIATETGADVTADVARTAEAPADATHYVPLEDAAPAQENGEDLNWSARGAEAVPSAEERAEAERQYREVEERYTTRKGEKKAGWMRAPNGQPTRLSERDWLRVRTDAFKRENGDWEALAIRRAIEATPNVEISMREALGEQGFSAVYHAYASKLKGWRKTVIDWVKAKYKVPVKTSIGEVEIRAGGIRSTLGHGRGPLKVLLFRHLDKLLPNAVFYGAHVKDGITHYNFAHRIRFDNRDWIARLVARESPSGKLYYDHEFSDVEEMKLAGAPPSGRGGPITAITPPHQPGKTLLQNIFSVKPESVTIPLDENGEPRLEAASARPEDGAQWSMRGAKVPEGMEDPFEFVLNTDAEVDRSPELRLIGSWFTARPRKAGQGRWDMVDADGRILAANLATYDQARFVLNQQRSELDRSIYALGKLAKADLARVADSRKKFLLAYSRVAVAMQRIARETDERARERVAAATAKGAALANEIRKEERESAARRIDRVRDSANRRVEKIRQSEREKRQLERDAAKARVDEAMELAKGLVADARASAAEKIARAAESANEARADARRHYAEAIAADKELARLRREAVHALREHMWALGIPKEVWHEAVGQFQRISGVRTVKRLAVVQDMATKFADTVIVNAAVRVLQRDVEKFIRRAEGVKTGQGVLLRAVTGVREIRAAYESKDDPAQIGARLAQIRANIQSVEAALASGLDLGGFLDSYSGEAAQINLRCNIDLAEEKREAHGYDEAREMLSALHRRLYAEQDAWTHFASLKHNHGFFRLVDENGKPVDAPQRTAADLARWIQARDYLKKITKATIEKRDREEKTRELSATFDRWDILRQMGIDRDRELAGTMDEARESREGRAIADWWNGFMFGQSAGHSLAELMVKPEKSPQPGLFRGKMSEIVETFHRCHWREIALNERREAQFAELLRIYGGASGSTVKERVESLERLYRERKPDDSFTAVNYARDKDGNLVMGRGKPITASLAELLPIPLIAMQGEEEAGLPFDAWLERYYKNPEAAEKLYDETGVPLKDGIFQGLMKKGWAPVVVEQIRKLHEEAGVGRLGEALSKFMDLNFNRLDAMVDWMYGGALKKAAHYCPIRRDYVSVDIGRSDDGLGGWLRMMASFLKERRESGLEINAYNLVDAAIDQVRRQNHLLAYYKAVDHARRIFGHRDMQIGMVQQLGEAATKNVNRWLAFVANGGRQPGRDKNGVAAYLEAVRRAYGIAAVTRVSTVVKQMTSAAATASFLPPGASVGRLWKDAARMSVDLKERERFLEAMKANIPDFRWRIKGNIDPLWQDLLSAKRTRYGRFAKKFAEVGGTATRWGDRWAVVTGSYGIFNAWKAWNLKQGMKEDAAEKDAWFRVSVAFNETQQSNMAEYLSAYQMAGGFVGFMCQFLSSPMAISRATNTHLRGLLLKRGSKKFHLACLASLLFSQRLFNLFSGEIFTWGSGDGDDDDWWRAFLRQLLALGNAAVGASVNGLLFGDDIWEFVSELAKRPFGLAKGRPWQLEASDLAPAVGTVNDVAMLLWQMFGGNVASDAQLRRLANVVGAATATPIPGAVALASGAWDAIANPEDDLTWWQRAGRALGYSRRQVGAE